MNHHHSVLVYHPCLYARIGIQAALIASGKKLDIRETANLHDDWQHDILSPEQPPDLLVTYIPASGPALTQTLRIIDEQQLQRRHALRVIVLTHRFTRPLVINWLGKYRGVCRVLDEHIAIRDLTKRAAALLSTGVKQLRREAPLIVNRLTSKENHIIQSLLDGESLYHIATTLNLNYKTISYHKLSALRKLGVPHFNALILGQLVSVLPPRPTS